MADHGHQHEITIHIDKKPYKVPEGAETGSQIRQDAKPPIGPDYDLWLEVPGKQDEIVEDTESVELKDGMHFFSAPRTINPGA